MGGESEGGRGRGREGGREERKTKWNGNGNGNGVPGNSHGGNLYRHCVVGNFEERVEKTRYKRREEYDTDGKDSIGIGIENKNEILFLLLQ